MMREDNLNIEERSQQALIVVKTKALNFLEDIEVIIRKKTKKSKDRVFFVKNGVAVLAPCLGYSGPVEPDIVIDRISSRLDKELENYFTGQAVEGKPYELHGFRLSDDYLKASKFLN